MFIFVLNHRNHSFLLIPTMSVLLFFFIISINIFQSLGAAIRVFYTCVYLKVQLYVLDLFLVLTDVVDMFHEPGIT